MAYTAKVPWLFIEDLMSGRVNLRASGSDSADSIARDTAYVVGDIAKASSYLFECVVAGTTDRASAPTFSEAYMDATVDGTVTWRCIGKGLRVGLVTSAWTFNQATSHFWSECSPHQAVVSPESGYPTDGWLLPECTVAYTSGEVSVQADNMIVGPLTLAAGFKYVVLYYDTGTTSTSPLVTVWSESVNQTPDDVELWLLNDAVSIMSVVTD